MKIVVGMSGGVDSTFAAYKLKKEGHDVIGVFISIEGIKYSSCTSSEDRRDAQRACAHLKIPFKVFEATDIYMENVINPFIESYKKGKTPNPDVLCNKFIKFNHFFKFAKDMGAECIATGHYAISSKGELYQSKDKKKDQTYFLWGIEKDVINSVAFPVGEYMKEEVRNIARRNKFPATEKKDSSGLCFLGDVDIHDFLKRHIQLKEGDVLDYESKEVIGKHFGSEAYTKGQRHGIEYTGDFKGPYYVVQKDVGKNIVYVSKEEDKGKKEYGIEETNFLSPLEGDIYGRIRHTGDLYKIKGVNEHSVCFEDDVSIAEGQSVVFYSQGKCLGGGVIK